MALPSPTVAAGPDEMILPSQDPWYTALPGFEACSPGTVLRVRTLPGSSIPFDHTSKAYHILYRTTGSRYQPAWGVASLFIPENPYTGNLILVLLGIMNEYPDADAYIRSRLRTDGSHNATAFLEGLDMQSLQAFRAFANQDIYAYFKNGQADLKESKVLRRIEKVEWMLGFHGTPEIPLFVYKAIGDHMTPIADTDEHIAQYKRFNVSILYERNTVGDHISEIENGQERAIEWLASVFDGTYDGLDQGVRICDVAVDIYKPPVA